MYSTADVCKCLGEQRLFTPSEGQGYKVKVPHPRLQITAMAGDLLFESLLSYLPSHISFNSYVTKISCNPFVKYSYPSTRGAYGHDPF